MQGLVATFLHAAREEAPLWSRAGTAESCFKLIGSLSEFSNLREQACASGGQEIVVAKRGIILDRGQFIQGAFRAMDFPESNDAIEGHDGRGIQSHQVVIEIENRFPIGGGRILCLRVNGSDGGLHVELRKLLAFRAHSQASRAKGDQSRVPFGAILILKENEFAIIVDTGGEPSTLKR